jgi:translation initiation factor 2 beta subunit (eIF-2beta)/eIF-5
MGWCREPLTLVAKTATKDAAKPTAACVHQDSIPKLVKRGWAQETPTLPQEFQDRTERRLLNSAIVYRYGNADPIDSFRAALFDRPHRDDLETLGNISPNPSNNHTLREILSPELLDKIKPHYSTAANRDKDIGITLQDYQDKHKVCKDGYDYYVKEPSSPDEKRLVIVQFNC